ncbi:hypothetical protein DDZ13_13040 [Coraliomargarita sinensis]|uniref:NTF2 fold immunity protein domain-containing protein n=1 Tax=Coraliomargarita sinensis TaxID=2174842 RepID=A0A317ZEV4_9BACT|nr:NTF2 fold immunity protein [Coraliomargarita sinensis]PXA03342.1 hypothetical protein DDZ13_13040 [Coraliomargarita sinensis]
MNQSSNCDFSSPESVTRSFIESMHQWEIESEQERRAARKTDDPASYQSKSMEKMNEIFLAFCTPKERKYGRQGSFQHPPEYDPEKEKITKTKEEGNLAQVESEREAILRGGKYRYILKRMNERWLIDRLEHNDLDTWKPHIL